jgi:hypothetical protein
MATCERDDGRVEKERSRVGPGVSESSVEARERRLSEQSVETVAARVQHLVDSRPPARCIEASYLGDLTAIAALATIAGRSAQKAETLSSPTEAAAALGDEVEHRRRSMWNRLIRRSRTFPLLGP